MSIIRLLYVSKIPARWVKCLLSWGFRRVLGSQMFAEQYRQSGCQPFRMAALLAIDNNDIDALWRAPTLGLMLEKSTEGEVFKWSQKTSCRLPLEIMKDDEKRNTDYSQEPSSRNAGIGSILLVSENSR